MDFLKFQNLHDSIIANTTGGGENSALSVIRISGPIEPASFKNVLSLKSGSIEPRKAYFCKILDDNKEVLDEIVFTFFRAPNSFTGENVFELSVHGNVLNVKKIIKFLKENLSLRNAGFGEFSYRALRNGKMNLSQIEGLDLLLNAKSDLAISSGLSLLGGELNKDFTDLKRLYEQLRSALELNIDFSEDIGAEQGDKLLKDSFNDFFTLLKKVKNIGSIEPDSLLRPQVALIGAPNAGKSTVFNNILGRKRAIVNERAGTTRDYITNSVFYKGTEFELVDTAGIRETSNEIEASGIESSKMFAKSAFFRVLVENTKEKSVDFGDFDLKIATRGDEFEEISINSILCNANDYPLLDLVFSRAKSKFDEITKGRMIFTDRQFDLIDKIYKQALDLSQLLLVSNDIGIVSSELNILGQVVDELFGLADTDAVLNSIFANFCIGK